MSRWILAAFVMIGCKQGIGDRCQVTADCQGGLVCNTGKNVCQGTSTANNIDATVPDAPKSDGGMPDAKVFMDAATGVAP